MKRELFASIIILLLTAVAIWNTVYLNKLVSNLTQQIETVQNACEHDNFTLAETELQNAFKLWNQNTKYTNTLLHPDNVESITNAFYSAKREVITLDKFEASVALNHLCTQLQTLLQIERISLESVF